MGALSPWHLAIILLAVLLLSGYKKLPDASRSIGRSLRIFKGEMQGLKDDDARAAEPSSESPAQPPVHGEVVPYVGNSPSDEADRLARAATQAEAHAALLRARAERVRAPEEAH